MVGRRINLCTDWLCLYLYTFSAVFLTFHILFLMRFLPKVETYYFLKQNYGSGSKKSLQLKHENGTVTKIEVRYSEVSEEEKILNE